jgi:(S)-mandelate dehydrogenase
MGRLDDCYNIADLRLAARKRLPKGIFEFIDLGVEDNIAIRNNIEAFQRLKLHNQVLVNLDDVSTATTLFGKPSSMPMAISPTGMAGLCWYQGELELAKAAAKAGIPVTLATGSVTPLEKLALDAGGRLWFQVVLWKDRSLTYGQVARARDAGFEALVVTVDSGISSNREQAKRNDFRAPYRFTRRNVPDLLRHPGWLLQVMGRYMMNTGIPRHVNYPEGYQRSILAAMGKTKVLHAMQGKDVTWDDVARLRDIWPRTLIVKGILHPDDAIKAVENGADGIVVSNHGGRHMDCAVATIDTVAEIVAAVGDRTTVILDSGVRRGSDIVKALGRGVSAVMSGRCTLYGVAVGGEAGAYHALQLLKEEYRQTLGYVGCLNAGEIERDVFPPPAAPVAAALN